MLLTAQEIIDQSLRLIGVLGVGTEVTPQEYQDCLLQLNLMIDRWNLNDLLVYSSNPHEFQLVPGKQSYTLGAGGDFDMTRPSRIERISIKYNSDTSTPLEFPIESEFSLEAWQNITLKNVSSTYPTCCYNNTGYPYMNLNFWPIPNANNASVVLYTWDLMPFITTLTNTVELPTGYTDAVIYNLAVRLSSMFDRAVSQQLLDEARQAKSDINDINSGAPALHCDPAFLGNTSSSIGIKTRGRVVF